MVIGNVSACVAASFHLLVFFLSCHFIQNLSRAVKTLERGSVATCFRRTAPAACAGGLAAGPSEAGAEAAPGPAGESSILQTSSRHW